MGKIIRKEFGERLKECRKQSGYTQAQAAKKLNMTQQQYSRFENDVYELNYEQIVEVCKLFDVSADYLLGINQF